MPCVLDFSDRRLAKGFILVATIATLLCPKLQSASGIGHVSSNLRPARGNTKTGLAVGLAQPNYLGSATCLRHWDKPLVTVFVSVANERRSASEIDEQVQKSIALWNTRLGPSLILALTDNAESADVKVLFVERHTIAGGAIGRTDVSFRRVDKTLTGATIHVETGLRDAELMQVVAHELGHALGIQGHSPNRHDLMYAYIHLPAEITDRDYNTMALSYNIIGNGTSDDPAFATQSDSANITTAENDESASEQ